MCIRAGSESGRGDPGSFSRRSANALRPERRAASDFGTNPCVTGETWIAVADGRGRVQIRDLAAEGKDVDVYTVKDNNLVIRTTVSYTHLTLPTSDLV